MCGKIKNVGCRSISRPAIGEFYIFFRSNWSLFSFYPKKLLCKTYQKIISLSPVTFKFKISQTQTNMETESNEIPIHWQTSLKCDNTSSRDRRSDCKERFANRNLTEWETNFLRALRNSFRNY